MATLNAIAAQPDQKNKIEQYKTALQQIVNSGSVKECQKFADHSKASMRAEQAAFHFIPPTPPHTHLGAPFCSTIG